MTLKELKEIINKIDDINLDREILLETEDQVYSVARINPEQNYFTFVAYEAEDYEEKCIACNGSGHYDHNGSPPCGSCEGTGYVVKTNTFRKK